MDLFLTDFGMMALISGVLSSIMTSLPGTVMILRRMSFLGSGIAHLSFLGVGLALILGFPIVPVVLSVSTIIAIFLGYLSRKGIHEDVGIGIMFTSSMALGMILVQISKIDTSRVMAYLFGDILAVSKTDIITLSMVTSLMVIYMYLFRDHLIYITFDEDFSKVLGLRIEPIYYTFLVLLSVSIVLSIKMMGIVLVSAMVVIPPASALLISKTYKGAFLLSPVISVISVFFGLSISYTFDLPSGACIVAVQGALFLLIFILKTLGR